MVLALHEEQLAEHGGSSGIRDESLLDSALAKPQNVFAYGDDPRHFPPRSLLCLGIARNHAFVDGNKRTALVVCDPVSQPERLGHSRPKTDEYDTYFRLAEGSLSEEELTAWLTRHAVPL